MMNMVWGWLVGYSIAVLVQATYAVYLLRHDVVSTITRFVSRVAITVHRSG